MAKNMVQARCNIGNFLPAEEMCEAQEDKIYYYTILGDTNDNTFYSNLTVRFPVESYGGKHYIFIA